MQKVYLVYVWEIEIHDSILYAVCGNESAVDKTKAELLNEGYAEKYIDVQETRVRI